MTSRRPVIARDLSNVAGDEDEDEDSKMAAVRIRILEQTRAWSSPLTVAWWVGKSLCPEQWESTKGLPARLKPEMTSEGGILENQYK
jgi:hypothetical protein